MNRRRLDLKVSFWSVLAGSCWLGCPVGCVAPHAPTHVAAPEIPVLRSSVVGTWRVEHVEVFAASGLSDLSEERVASLRNTWSRTDRTNEQLRNETLAILHLLNEDGSYEHSLDWAATPDRRFVEVGTWSIDEQGVLRCVNQDGGPSSLPEAQVLFMDDFTLIVRMEFPDKESGGTSEIVRHRRAASDEESPSRR